MRAVLFDRGDGQDRDRRRKVGACEIGGRQVCPEAGRKQGGRGLVEENAVAIR
jgi:hypothetical protein